MGLWLNMNYTKLITIGQAIRIDSKDIKLDGH